MDNYIQETDGQNTNKTKLIRNVIIGILVIIVIGGIIYYVLNKKNTPESANPGILFPSSENIGGIINNIVGVNNEDNSSDISKKDLLIELYKGPISGYTILSDSRVARVFDRSKGLMFDVNLNTGDIKNVTDQPILKVHDALFINDNTLVTRSLDVGNVIKTNLYEFTRDDSSEMLKLSSKPVLLSDNILELSKSQNNKYLSFVIKNSKGCSIDIYDTETKEMSRLIELPISEWIPFVSNYGQVFITSKASRYFDGGVYKITNKTLDILFSARTAQTSLISPNGDVALSVYALNNEFISRIKSVDNISNNSNQLESLNPLISTLSDKCAWSNNGKQIFCGKPSSFGTKTPDEWYLGNTSYDDSLWFYDLKKNKNTMLISSGNKIDTINLMVDGNMLFFKNKTNQHLWGYRLNFDTNDYFEEQGSDQLNNNENQ